MFSGRLQPDPLGMRYWRRAKVLMVSLHESLLRLVGERRSQLVSVHKVRGRGAGAARAVSQQRARRHAPHRPQTHIHRPTDPMTHQTNLLQAWQGGRRQVIPSDQDMFVRLPLKCGARYGIARCEPETSRQYAGQGRRREWSTEPGGERGEGASWVIQPA